MRQSKLFQQITDPVNIYNAIYALESYIFERHLLSASDIRDFNKLKDKFDDTYITEYISKCKKRIESIIIGDKLFNCEVFFKAKKYNEVTDSVEFRPIHTASLLDQICMVVLLSTLMFDDISGKRKLSAISRLLPANFYGNIPSKNVTELFKPWNKQYKDYSTDALTANRNHFESKKYKYELTLDLERFFPSINPAFIFNFILNKWPVNALSDEKKCLSKILEKLLFFNLNLPNDLKKFYYPSTLINGKNLKYNIGIAQGLPQAYFFGNICMAIIAKHENKLLNGDSYFYVDDSIIYTNEKVDQEKIEKLVSNINSEVKEYTNATEITNIKLRQFQKQVEAEYILRIHPLGKKSEFKKIDKIDSLYFLAKPASLLPFEIRTAQDEYEDISLLKKAKALLNTIDILIERIKNEPENQTELKRLHRYRKFYLNRLNYLKISQSADLLYDETEIDRFINDFQLKTNPSESDFFEKLDSDVFCFESQMIAEQINNIPELKEKFLSSVLDFELQCLNNNKLSSSKFLYFNKVLSTISELDVFPSNRYESLKYSKLTQGINSRNRSNSESKISNIKAIIDLAR
jgi:hypothetical protein